jgi:hypothetical protein
MNLLDFITDLPTRSRPRVILWILAVAVLALLLTGAAQAQACPAGTVPARVWTTQGYTVVCVRPVTYPTRGVPCYTVACWCQQPGYAAAHPGYCRSGGR